MKEIDQELFDAVEQAIFIGLKDALIEVANIHAKDSDGKTL